MSDPKRLHEAEQREAAAADLAGEIAAFYKRLRARGVPPGAAQAITESYTAGVVDREDSPPEPWQR